MQGANRTRTGRARRLRRTETEAEGKLWYRLNNRQLAGHKFVRQEPIGPYIADLACRECKLTVELDGSQHAESARDQVRDVYFASLGYRVLRFWNAEVFTNMDGVLATILAALDAASPPHPRCARFVPDKGDEALSPPAGRGDGRLLRQGER